MTLKSVLRLVLIFLLISVLPFCRSGDGFGTGTIGIAFGFPTVLIEERVPWTDMIIHPAAFVINLFVAAAGIIIGLIMMRKKVWKDKRWKYGLSVVGIAHAVYVTGWILIFVLSLVPSGVFDDLILLILVILRILGLLFISVLVIPGFILFHPLRLAVPLSSGISPTLFPGDGDLAYRLFYLFSIACYFILGYIVGSSKQKTKGKA